MHDVERPPPYILSNHSMNWATTLDPLTCILYTLQLTQIPWKPQWDTSKKNRGAACSKQPREAKLCLLWFLNLSTYTWRFLMFWEKSPSRAPKLTKGNCLQLWQLLQVVQHAHSFARRSLKVGDWEPWIPHRAIHPPALCFILESSSWRDCLWGFCQLFFPQCIKLHGTILRMTSNNKWGVLVKVQHMNFTFREDFSVWNFDVWLLMW